jgi:hypothetical protein
MLKVRFQGDFSSQEKSVPGSYPVNECLPQKTDIRRLSDFLFCDNPRMPGIRVTPRTMSLVADLRLITGTSDSEVWYRSGKNHHPQFS